MRAEDEPRRGVYFKVKKNLYTVCVTCMAGAGVVLLVHKSGARRGVKRAVYLHVGAHANNKV